MDSVPTRSSCARSTRERTERTREPNHEAGGASLPWATVPVEIPAPAPRRHLGFWIAVCVVGMTMLVLVGFALAERVVARGEIVGGVQIAGSDASGLSEADASIKVAGVARRLESDPVRVRIGNTDEVVAPATIGLRVNVPATVRRARSAGRGSNPISVVAGAVLRRFRPDKTPLVVSVDTDRLDAVLEFWRRATAVDLHDGMVKVEDSRVVEVAPHAGVGLRAAQARVQLLRAWRSGRRSRIQLAYGRIRPDVDRPEVAKVAAQTRALLTRPHTIVLGTNAISLLPSGLAPTITISPRGRRLVVGVDPARLHDALAPKLAGIERAPIDATWSVNGTTATVVPSVAGSTLDTTPIAAAIVAGNHRIVGTLVPRAPEHDTAWAQALHITELVSTFTTKHKCCEARVTNIHRAADVIDNTVVLPGQTFSLNQALGPRTLAKGYVMAPAIGEDLSLVEDVGGGVSQVSTTLFNATYFGGYEDVTHEVHSIYISRYPKGREATLNYPSIDNQFRNDTDAGVLIKASYTDTSLTISFYGSKAGRTVSSEGPNTLETIDPPDRVHRRPHAPGRHREGGEGRFARVRRREHPDHLASGPTRRPTTLRRPLPTRPHEDQPQPDSSGTRAAGTSARTRAGGLIPLKHPHPSRRYLAP